MSTLALLIANPFASFAYLFLLTALVSCWFCPKYYIFAPIYIIAYALAYVGEIVTYTSLLPLSVILICLLCLKLSPQRFFHFFCGIILGVVGVAMMTHMVKGFDNLLLIKGVTFGNSKLPINLYLNFDKVSLAVFLLGLYIPLIQSKEQCKQMFFITIPWAAFSVILLFLISKGLHIVAVDIKFPRETLYFLIVNFFFVAIPEEAFYRGFLQAEIVKGLPNKAAPLLAILTVSLLFGFIHIFFIHFLYFTSEHRL